MRAGQLVAGRYRIDRQLGSGGNGMVWRATDERLPRQVALKRALSNDGAGVGEQVELLKREAEILARLNHPYVVTLYDVVRSDDVWWLVMEYAPGRSLAEQGELSVEQAATVGVQLANALEALHAKGIVHRDIKPANVLICDDGRAKLGDFGISRDVRGAATITATDGLFAGTPGYLAPEVAQGDEPSEASDVFSLGATLFAAVEGTSPFGATDNQLATLRRTAEGEIAAPERAGALGPILAALLATDPRDRPSASRARILLGELAGPDVVIEPLRPRPEARHRNARRAAVVAVAAVAVLGLTAWMLVPLWAKDSPPGPATALGEPRTADPCALLDPSTLDKYGQTELDTDYGNFNRCDVLVSGDEDGEARVSVEFERLDERPRGPSKTVSGFDVVSLGQDSDGCDRKLPLHDDYYLAVSADRFVKRHYDLCGMADAATKHAIAVMARGPIPRRDPKPDDASLIRLKACDLMTAKARARFPGIDTDHRVVGFGGWDCQWHSTSSGDTLSVGFDRDDPKNVHDGDASTLSGHLTFAVPNGYGDDTCLVRIIHRHYTDGQGFPTVDIVKLVLRGSASPNNLCTLATKVAAPVAAALPHV